jgi:UPF0176 protein
MTMDYRVLLYYNFVKVEDPEAEREAQEQFCKEQGLLGRILISKEGINGTVSGPKEATEAYKAMMAKHPIFHATEWKEDIHDDHTFLKMHVRVKNEIVHFGVEEADPTEQKGKYIEPEEFREILKRSDEDEDIVILDARSNYETAVGKFKNAVTLDIETFRELPEHIDELEQYKGKTIYTYFTGGIKCEKVSVWLEQNGFEDVYQLHGGIVRYGKEAGGEGFEGSCYVFDQRLVVPVNEVDPTVLGTCNVCNAPTERIINCANAACNEHILICDSCVEELEGCCSEECMTSPRRREFDGRGYYMRGVNSKNFRTHNSKPL